MNKKDKQKHIKLALLLSVAMDLDLNDDITDASGAIVDELYTMPRMQQSTFVQDMASQFEKDVTVDTITVAQLLYETLVETKLIGKRFDRLKDLLSEFCNFNYRDNDLHAKVETLIRHKYKEYEQAV